MASYFNRLESLIEKWQSRRKTIEISSRLAVPRAKFVSPLSKRQAKTIRVARKMAKRPCEANNQQENSNNSSSNNKENKSVQQCDNIILAPQNSGAAYKLIRESRHNTQYQTAAGSPRESLAEIDDNNNNSDELDRLSAAAAGPASGAASLLYVVNISSYSNSSMYALALTCLLLCLQSTTQLTALADGGTGGGQVIRGPGSGGGGGALPLKSIADKSLEAIKRSLSLGLIEQLASGSRPRWTLVPGDGPDPLGSNRRPPGAWSQSTSSVLQRLVNRISARIGARNSIRVHNAFRDFAWRILSSLSMPTPVIYELRRQHLYSPEDDQMNDSLFNRNTTRTIRSKRYLEPKHASQGPVDRASNDDDEDDEPESLVDRIRSRLDDLVSLSRRSLFGRVIRLPSLFPFKRQEEEDKQEVHKDGALVNIRRRRLSRRRRRKEADRQLITINGKQYYVNDNGELKELNNQESTDR